MKDTASVLLQPDKRGYPAWHYERHRKPDYSMKRHLVFMTYLNTVDDEGETEFWYQRKYIQPRKGRTLIWPAEWTHTHRGIPSQTQDKYIITGWYSYVD